MTDGFSHRETKQQGYDVAGLPLEFWLP